MAKGVKKIVLGYVPEGLNLSEQFKGQVETKPVRFPRELGEEHPFNFKDCEDTYIRYGLVKAAVDKHLDFIFSKGFHIETEDEKSDLLVNSLLEEKDFMKNLRTWAQEAFIKGNGFMEVAVSKDSVDLKVVNANDMYVNRDKKGEIQGYSQYVGSFDKFNPRSVISFSKDEIAHLSISKVGDDAYGLGLVYPALSTVNNLIRSEKDMHILISRKANSPIVATIGSPEEPATQADVSALGQQLIYLNNLHEWAFSHQVKFDKIDFGNIGEKFADVLNHDKETLFYIFQIPAVIMGMANVAEGLAVAQLDTFERRIKSLQEEISDVIEEQIIEPFLKLNGLDVEVEIEWGQPSEDSVNKRVAAETLLLSNPQLSPELRAMLEKDIALNLGFEDDIDSLVDPGEAHNLIMDRKQENMDMITQTQQKMPQNQNPNKERSREETKVKMPKIPKEMRESIELTVREFVNFQEIAGFNYIDYIDSVVNAVKDDEFSNLLAKTEEDIKNGLLSDIQIESLKEILTTGFRENKTIREIEIDIKNNIQLRDRLTDGVVSLSADVRANAIARTETVRLSNIGLLDLYSNNKIEEVRYLASISDRTCDECLSYNGQVYSIDEAYDIIPVHPNCRCTFISIKN